MSSLATLSIDKDAIGYNIKSISYYIGPSSSFIPVIKADMYGIGLHNIIDCIENNNCSIIAVAHVSEAMFLRKLRYMHDIIVLNQPFFIDINEVIDNSLSINCGDISFLLLCQKQAATRQQLLNIHIEIDIGMGRTGLHLNDVNLFIKTLKMCPNIIVKGIFTHLPDSSNFDYSQKQLNIFYNVVNLFKNNIGNIQYIHALASSGIFRYYNLKYKHNAVRSGLAMLGYYPANVNKSLISLIPSITLFSQILSCKKYPAYSKIGYNRYCLKRASTIAVIPIGFADILIGYDAPGGYAVIHNCKAEIISICMDTMMIDVTDIKNASVGDTVYIWDNKNVTLDDWGTWCKSSIYEIISLMSNRIDRIIK